MKKRYISLFIAIPLLLAGSAQLFSQTETAQYKTRVMVETADQFSAPAGWNIKKETIKPFEAFLCTDPIEMAPKCGTMTRVWEVNEEAEIPMNAYDNLFREETEWVLDLDDSTFLACITPPENYLIIPTVEEEALPSSCRWNGRSRTGEYDIFITLDNRREDGEPATVELVIDSPKAR